MEDSLGWGYSWVGRSLSWHPDGIVERWAALTYTIGYERGWIGISYLIRKGLSCDILLE